MRPAKPLDDREVSRPAPPHPVPLASAPHRRTRKLLFIAGLVLAGILVAAVVFLAWKWPFTPDHVRTDLEHASSTKVSFQKFQQTFFPPGCVVEQVTFRDDQNPSGPPLLTLQKLAITASYAGLLAHRVGQIRAEGAHVSLPPIGTTPKIFKGSSNAHDTKIGELIADAAMLDVGSGAAGGSPLHFKIRKLTIKNLGADEGMSFHIEATIPKLPGEVIATAKLGRWNAGNPALTQLSGTYQFRRAQLGVIHAIAGTLDSEGRFQGPLKNLEVRGSTDTPDFEVTRTHHKIHLTTKFDAVVDATAGDIVLRSIEAHSDRTTVTGNGKIAGTPGARGKTASLHLFVKDGRIEDVLYLFVRGEKSPLEGVTTFETRVTIPPGEKKFVDKVVLDGNFDIHSAQFTNPQTQSKLNQLTAQARGVKNPTPQDAEPVTTDWQGQVLLKDGDAHFSQLRVSAPGATANLHGTYQLETQKIHLDGMLFMQATLSQATSGIKSALLKPLEPFLKKNRHGGAKMPVGIRGTYSHPSYQKDPI